MSQTATIIKPTDMRLEYIKKSPSTVLNYLPKSLAAIALPDHIARVEQGPMGTIVNQWVITKEYELCASIFSCQQAGMLQAKVNARSTTFYLAIRKKQVMVRTGLFSKKEKLLPEGDIVEIPFKQATKRFRVRYDEPGVYISLQLSVKDPRSALLQREESVVNLLTTYRNFIEKSRVF